jgi:DNA invertase Pin-like site-specific DNA recombinase
VNKDKADTPAGKLAKNRVGLYARISTHDQKTLSLQISQMKKYVSRRGWTVAVEIKDICSGAKERPKREEILKLARQGKIDHIIVWKLDRWSRSLLDLVSSLKELSDLEIGFVSLTEALDLTTPTGRAMTGLLSVFAEFERDILRERVKAGIAHAQQMGIKCGRPLTVALKIDLIKKLKSQGKNHSEIARKLKIGRTSVRRLLSLKNIKNTKRGLKSQFRTLTQGS